MKKICPKFKLGFTLIRTLVDTKNLDKVQPLLIAGFTLIELLTVIAIIAILSSFVIVTTTGQTQRARDAQRKSDINQYRIAIENYSIKQNGVHPIGNTTNIGTNTICTSTLRGGGYIASCVSDPNGTSGYAYQSDANGIDYILWAKLERCSSGTTCYWYACANGTASENLSQPSTSDCGFL